MAIAETAVPTKSARNHDHRTFRAASEWGARDSTDLPGETGCGVHVVALTAIFQVPARGRLGAVAVLVAQVIGVRVTFWREVIKPGNGPSILIGQRDSCRMNTSLSRAVPSHVENGSHPE